MSVADLSDPRTWPDAGGATGEVARLHALARAAVEAATTREADRLDEVAVSMLQRFIATRSREFADAFATAPSAAVARHLRRLLARLERGAPERSATIHTTLVALPVVLVAALDASAGEVTLTGVVPDPRALGTALRDAQAFGGAREFALSPTLVRADAIDIRELPALLARRALVDARDGAALPPLEFAPAPILVRERAERVHLRFIVGAVLTVAGADPLRATAIARWGIPFAQALSRQLAAPGASLLALPRPPERLVPALQSGRAAQREASARLFASNAIRKFRASVGEPAAIISAHRAADAMSGGELRLSLSSPFALRAAEGFRCPLHPYESVRDVASMLAGVLRDCRVDDVRLRTGVHADHDPLTGAPLFFKDAGAAEPLH